jgi:3-hydroxyisobutyrate dehydrogenase-like beta-hydroxyacid dehydrogenase
MPDTSSKTKHTVAFIGLGVMGFPMASHLQRAGHHVTVYNRTNSKAQAWVEQNPGARSAPTPAQAALGAEFVFSCVGNDDDLRSVTLGEHGTFAAMEPGSIYVDHTTASADVAHELAQAASQKQLHFMDAPVSGGQSGAENGVLTIMAGGESAVFERVKPVVMAYARAFTLIGPHGSGQLAKMVNQICLAGMVQALAEAIAFGQKAGLDMPLVLNVIGKGAASSWQMENRGPSMVENRFDFGFAVDWMRKDLGLAMEMAKRTGARLPVTALVDQFYASVQAMGGNRQDTSALIRLLNDKNKSA